jgi:hypothetical protein
MKQLIAIGILAALTASACTRTQGADLPTTLAWLKSNIALTTNEAVIKPGDFSTCNLTFGYDRRQVILPLTAVDPTKITVERWFSSMVGIEDGYAVRLLTKGGEPVKGLEESALPGISLPYRDRAFAQRVANAFEHAARLCGGQKEAF